MAHNPATIDRAGAWFGQGYYRIAVWLLLALVLVLSIYPVVRSFAGLEINYNEGWNGYLQQRAMRGEPIYSGHSPFFFCNYPPLSFYIVGLIGKTGIDPVLAGRLLSMFALVAIGLAIFRIVRGAGGEATEALAATGVCLIAFVTFYAEYVGMNDPQLLGMACMLTALAMHLSGGGAVRPAVSAAALIAAGILIKHNLLAVPAIVSIDVLIRGNARQRLAFFGTGLALACAAAGWLWLREGAAFFDHLLAPRIWSAHRAAFATADLLMRHQGLVVLAGLGLLMVPGAIARLVLGYGALAFALGAYFIGGEGTAANIFFDLVVALSIGAGLVLGRMRAAGLPAPVMIGALALATFGPLLKAPLVLGAEAAGLTGELARRQSAFADDVAWLKARPGPALCESLLLCLRAGKPMDVDMFNTFEAIGTGRMAPDALTRRIAARAFGAVQINFADVPEAMASPAVARMVAAIRANYHVERRGESGRLLVPDGPAR